ncbi:MAG: hypothetical protein DWH97_01205 [Planctomycetota bacterium]|jgi:hypothetical protein|nr:MAG: hypothetical protein DWH97_01205 [Planctomycetota bacterium]RLS93540.1 MAG: hypothetical protein DWI12_08830 [Planctomycetota bacterium]
MRLPATILTTSAIAITALAIVEAGRLQPAAFAATAATGLGGFTAITSSVGQGPDEAPYETLYILDNRGEMIYVYGIDSPTDRRLVLRGGASLPALFRAARGG